MQNIHNSDPLVTLTPVKPEEPTHEKKDVAPSTPVKSVRDMVILSCCCNGLMKWDNILFQNNNVIMDTVLPSSRPASNALSSISVDENTLELRDIDQDDSILDELDISKHLVFKKPDEEGPDIRGGHPDALLIHATKANKHGK